MPNRIAHLIPYTATLAVIVAACLASPAAAAMASDTLTWHPQGAESTDTLRFEPGDDSEPRPMHFHGYHAREDAWLQAPFGNNLLSPLDLDRERIGPRRHADLILDYNRVDQLRFGLRKEFSSRRSSPRLGLRLEYSDGRDQVLYGVQVEQPLVPSARFAVGVSFTKRTDHHELQQIDDLENSLAMLLGRQDYRDYFDREGVGAYLMWRVPDFSTVSLHIREDTWGSLETNHGAHSWFHTNRPLRENPPIDDGTTQTLTLRLERLLHRSARTRAGVYHWLELEKSGSGLGGDFSYLRGLADVRSMLRLSPAMTLATRAVAGSALDGTLPRQKEFTLGGVDGLRAHAFDAYRGDQIALAQVEYSAGLWRFTNGLFEGGLQAIVFLDTGLAWTNPDRRYDLAHQQMQNDAGFGFGTADDNLRLYVARDLQRPGSDYLVSVRLRRPF